MLLSAGGFAIYHTESSVFNVLNPCFGSLSGQGNRRRLIDAWIRSRLFERSGLDQQEIRMKIMAECHSAGDFLRIVMGEISRSQNVSRWADCTPEHLLYIPEIKKAFPNALVIHMIRDGRDVALSLERQHWIRPLFSGINSGLLAAGLYWEWVVGRGRKHGRDIAQDYLEVRFESLVQAPRQTLQSVSVFIDQDLDYDKIQKTAIGSVKKPNTSFGGASDDAEFAPVSRWKTSLAAEDLGKLEALIGRMLKDLGYAGSRPKGSGLLSSAIIRNIYRINFGSKLWLKRNTRLGQIFMRPDLSWL
jgi:hypothetical protein